MWWRRATDGKVNNEVLRNETFVAKGVRTIFQTCLIVVFLCEKWERLKTKAYCTELEAFLLFLEKVIILNQMLETMKYE